MISEDLKETKPKTLAIDEMSNQILKDFHNADKDIECIDDTFQNKENCSNNLEEKLNKIDLDDDLNQNQNDKIIDKKEERKEAEISVDEIDKSKNEEVLEETKLTEKEKNEVLSINQEKMNQNVEKNIENQIKLSDHDSTVNYDQIKEKQIKEKQIEIKTEVEPKNQIIKEQNDQSTENKKIQEGLKVENRNENLNIKDLIIIEEKKDIKLPLLEEKKTTDLSKNSQNEEKNNTSQLTAMNSSTINIVKIDWRKQLNDNNVFSQTIPYSYNKLQEYLEKTNENLDQLKPLEFFLAVFESTKALKVLSTALKYAFSDITEKVDICRVIIKDFLPGFEDIQSIMLHEISINIHKLNGDNNSDLGHKKNSKYYTYQSMTRTILRILWFLQYIMTMYNMIMTTNDKLCDVMRKTYDIVLAPHHGWLIRKSAAIALKFAPDDRKPLFEGFFGTGLKDGEYKEKITKLHGELQKLTSYLQKWYEGKKLLDLP